MRWVTCVTAPILLADVGDYRVRVLSLDLKRSDERIFGVHGDVVRLPFQFKPDGELHAARLLYPYFGPDVRRWQGVLLGAIKLADDLGLDYRKGCRLVPGVSFEAGAAERVVSSRRKTSRAVITRTIIDGSTVDMRESPDRIVFAMASWRRG